MFEAISETIASLATLLREAAEALAGGQAIAEIEPPRDALRALWKEWEPKFIRYLSWKREMKLAPPEDPILDLHFAWQRFIAILNLFGPGLRLRGGTARGGRFGWPSCAWTRRGRWRPFFARPLRPFYFPATLSPVEMTRRMLGLEKERTRSITLPPPFPREHRKVMILPQVRTTFAAREKNFGAIAAIGRANVRRPERQRLGFVSELSISGKGGGKDAADSRPVAGAASEHRPSLDGTKFSTRWPRRRPGGILLLAVLGGMYAEGVDYPGELLTGVYIVSPALPQVSFERELLRRYFEETEQAGFEYAYLQPGMTRVIQAAGRLIRNETDRGVIALLCQRFLQEPYVSRLPRDWYDEWPAQLIAHHPAEEIRKFFGGAAAQKIPPPQ